MAFKESNSEEKHWKKVLETYERVPSERAKRQFQSRLSAQPQTKNKAWFWGVAAGISLIGAWWMFQPTPKMAQSSMAIRSERSGDVQKNWVPVPAEPSMRQEVATEVTLAKTGFSQRKKTSRTEVESYNPELRLNESMNSQVVEETDALPRLAMEVAPLRGRDVQVGGPQERQMTIAYVASTGSAESFKRSPGLGQFIEELMILKYGEPVEDKPTLAALLAGEERNLLAAERAELKERFSWIKDKVTK